MKTIVSVDRRDNSGYKMRGLTLTEQTQVTELVELFLAADLKTKEEILIKLR